MICRLVVIGGCILIDFDRYILCFCDHCIRLCVVFFIVCLVFSAFFYVLFYVNLSFYIRQLVVCWSFCYQLQGDKTHHTKHTTTHRKGILVAKTSVFTEQDDRCGYSSTKLQAPEDGYINVRNMLSA